MSAPVRVDQLDTPAVTAARSHPRAHTVVMTRASVTSTAGLTVLPSISIPEWEDLTARAIEPNACYLPLWALAVANHARGRGDALALTANDPTKPGRLTAMMPVRWARRALSLPVPLLVSWNAYAPFSVPLLDRDCAVDRGGHAQLSARGSRRHARRRERAA
jgi:hypothetical protein